MFKRFAFLAVAITLAFSGCAKPFQVPKFEKIEPHEFAFLVPYGKTSDQVVTGGEEFWKKTMINAKEIEIPQVWVQEGRANGEGRYKDEALLIKVDGSPVTRSWTKDPNTGTSTKDESIWVMSSDQIKWTVGWSCTARIASIEDAAKFLSNYPNGKLVSVMDQDILSKLTTQFNLAVTDIPIDQMQKAGTPVFKGVTKDVTEFFKGMGITITNLGINGPYVYDNKEITAKLEEKYKAAQEAEINKFKTAAKSEENKALQLVAEQEAKTVLTKQEAVAAGIKLVADAKAYEIEKANKDLATYLKLKSLENDKAAIEKWLGTFPSTMLSGQTPFSILRSEKVEAAK